MAENKSSNNANIFMVLFALVSLLTLIGAIFGLIVPDDATGRLQPELASLCAGPLFGSLGAIGMLWLRNRLADGKKLAASIALWFTGISLLAWGIFTAANPGSHSFATNLGYSIALCFTPGSVLALLGLLTFWYTQLRNAPARPAPAPANAGADDLVEIRRRATEYKRLIFDLERQHRRSPLGGPLAAIQRQIEGWEVRVSELADRLERFGRDQVLQRDALALPARIEDLQGRLDREQDADVRGQMEETLAGHQAHRTELEALFSLMRRTRLQLDETLAAMGTIYSRVQIVTAMDIDSGRAARISEEIQDQADRLGDLLAAMREAYEPAPSTTSESEERHARRSSTHVHRSGAG